jgi:hypothetical protein
LFVVLFAVARVNERFITLFINRKSKDDDTKSYGWTTMMGMREAERPRQCKISTANIFMGGRMLGTRWNRRHSSLREIMKNSKNKKNLRR